MKTRRWLQFVGMGMPGPVADDFLRLFAEHPALCVPKAPLHYFGDPQQYAKGRGWYESQFSHCDAVACRGEWSTSYLTAPGAAERMAREYPDARVFMLIPDPLEAVAAAYAQTVPEGMRATQTLEAFLETSPTLLDRFKFGRWLAVYYSYYSPVDLLVLTHNELRDDPVRTFRVIARHLKVDSGWLPRALTVLDTEVDERRPARWERLLRLPQLRAYYQTKKRVVASRLFPMPAYTLSARERVLLSQYYEADVTQLSTLLHRSLAAEWRHPRPHAAPRTKKSSR